MATPNKKKIQLTPAQLEEREKKMRQAFWNNGRLIVKTTYIELPITLNMNKIKFPDQPNLRTNHFWYVDVLTQNVMVNSNTGKKMLTDQNIAAASICLSLYDYDGYNFMDRKPCGSLVTTFNNAAAPKTSVEQSDKNGLVGQCINWTQSYVEIFHPAAIAGLGYTPSLLLEVCYSEEVDWRDDPLSSFDKQNSSSSAGVAHRPELEILNKK